jgi:RimJ/RimL family protein N-acetyltransferase
MRLLNIIGPQKAEIVELTTERLLLRQWRAGDLAKFAQINADPEVMKFYPKLLSRQESNAAANKFKTLIEKNGWGFWALESIHDRAFLGLVGLHRPVYKMPFDPCVEVGWRLASDCWGNGYATEAANACLDFAFTELKLSQVYSFASVSNMKSRAVMERLNMVNIEANFDHPTIPYYSPLREHVAYKIDKQRWQSDRNRNLEISFMGENK